MKKLLSLILILTSLYGYSQEFTKADTLRGTLTPLRVCYDVHYYSLNLDIDIANKSISGYNDIYYNVVNDFKRLQIDLFENMAIDSIVSNDQILNYTREFNAVFIDFPEDQKMGNNGSIRVYYHGSPQVAENAPWDGGFVWSSHTEPKTENKQPWVGVACEGLGASVWWPNKDHLSDEPDSMTMSFTIPDSLVCVGNGRLKEEKPLPNSKKQYTWHVSYPINNYNVTLNITNYAHFHDIYTDVDGRILDLDYYVLPEHLEKAKKQFKQVQSTLKCYGAAFGEYPFWEDGYKLVETPYLGMEHQGAIAYGNKYMPGYMGFYPYDMDFDYIIIHETGHEWWGNSISMNDLADMWIHESFCTYSEAVYVECIYGYEKMLDYLLSQRKFINNKSPIIGIYGVNNEGNSTDMYYKGSWMLHTLRTVIDNDSLWHELLLNFSGDNKLSNLDAKDVVAYFNKTLGQDLTWFFNEYLNYSNIPTFEYTYKKGNKKTRGLMYRWNANTTEFQMPVKINYSGNESQIITPSSEWQTLPMDKKTYQTFGISMKHYLIEMENVELDK